MTRPSRAAATAAIALAGTLFAAPAFATPPPETRVMGWSLPDGGTPDNVTWPQTPHAGECGVWVQWDTYPYGTAKDRARTDALDDDGVLSYGEDHGWVIKWRFEWSGDCAPEPTPEPTVEPTPEPEPEPTVDPTPEPTPEPEPTVTPDPVPTVEPTVEPAPAPVESPAVVVPVPDVPAPAREVAQTSAAPAELAVTGLSTGQGVALAVGALVVGGVLVAARRRLS